MKRVHVQIILFGFVLCVARSEAQTVTGSGTAGTVPVFTGNGISSTLGNSSTPITVSGSNVGIGTTSPSSLFHIYGRFTSTGIPQLTLAAPDTADGSNAILNFRAGIQDIAQVSSFYSSSAGNGYGHLLFSTRNGEADGPQVRMSITEAGNVGIGTTNPVTMLDVGGVTFVGHNGNTSAPSLGTIGGSGDKILLWGGSASAYPYSLGINTNNMWASVPSGAYFSWYESGSEVMRVNSSGNVGIGTTSPNAKLEVAGSIKLTNGSGASVTFADGTAQTTAWTGTVCGGDYAESVDVAGERSKYGPGDVLVITSEEGSDVAKSSDAYSTAVVGIYSTKPGTVGRRQNAPKSESEVPMAMIGIVPTKVSAENGPIHRGDLLVTSSKPGYAMKGTDRSRMLGAVIGKAMGRLDSGSGAIEVAVTLQ